MSKNTTSILGLDTNMALIVILYQFILSVWGNLLVRKSLVYNTRVNLEGKEVKVYIKDKTDLQIAGCLAGSNYAFDHLPRIN